MLAFDKYIIEHFHKMGCYLRLKKTQAQTQ